jgi:hypothetical protein
MLYFQVFLCFGNSVASTRFLLQDEFNIQTTQCDNCIIVLHCPPIFALSDTNFYPSSYEGFHAFIM